MENEKYMRIALELAREAMEDAEVPVGCVIVRNDKVVGKGRNRRENNKNALAHAEIEAINDACNNLGGWRLPECSLYVTLEPCPMCAGAIINARIDRVIFGAHDKKSGSLVSVLKMYEYNFNHKPEIVGGILEEECAGILTEFFRALRK